jgi:hypothetical protein
MQLASQFFGGRAFRNAFSTFASAGRRTGELKIEGETAESFKEAILILKFGPWDRESDTKCIQ